MTSLKMPQVFSMATTIANRLKLVLNSLISPNQSAFLPGRLISDNIIIAQEVAHSIKLKSRGKSGWMAVKLDMAKAFDRVEWPFIVAILRKFQFPHRFIHLIFACISTAKFQFNLNGKVVGNVIPSRGIRQGDPLSPYLFLLCAEGFSSLLHQQERNNAIVGFKVARRAPAISHLLFADDSFLFCQASISSCNTIKEVLQSNKALKGQAHDQTHAILDLAHSYLAEFQHSQSAPVPISRTRDILVSRSPPASGLLKLNVDATISKNIEKVGFGGIIRNSDGLVVAALAQPYIGGGAVATLEAKSLLSMLRWCIDEHFLVQEVETDCKAITDALTNNKEDVSVFGDLICQIKEALSLIPNA
uniref:Reverse transcriptase domain-containing protein n=1 Tax=Cannabis sativa TaxID=3483 RepID=A0A803PA42_CANSA